MHAARLEFGFSQADYSESESDSLVVKVIKCGANIGIFVVTVTQLTYSQFENMGLPLPLELPIDMRPSDPAECEHNHIEYVQQKLLCCHVHHIYRNLYRC